MISNRIQVLAAAAAVVFAGEQSAMAAPEIYDLNEPAGWTVGSSLSTYQDWARNGAAETLAGTPKVGSNSAGAGLPLPTLIPTNGGFEASIGFYSFMGEYGFSANIENHDPVSPPTGSGTHVIVQTFAGINTYSVKDVQLSAPGAVHLGTSTYGYGLYMTPFDPVTPLPFQATIDEFWIPNFVGDFTVTGDVDVHSSFRELRVDTKIGVEVPGGVTPFAVTVPEPTSLGLLGLAGVGLLARRLRQSASV